MNAPKGGTYMVVENIDTGDRMWVQILPPDFMYQLAITTTMLYNKQSQIVSGTYQYFSA